MQKLKNVAIVLMFIGVCFVLTFIYLMGSIFKHHYNDLYYDE